MGQPELSKTAELAIPTRELLAKLAFFGATEQDLKNEVFQDNLPGPKDGLWSPIAARRAQRLFRLRHIGLRGKMLKLLLFIADGWGWDGIRDTCVTGLERIAALSLNGVERYARAKGDLSFSVEDIAEHQHRALVKKVGENPDLHPTSNESTAFSVGLLRDGTPLKGGTSRRLLEPLLKTWFRGIPQQIVDFAVYSFDGLATVMDLRVSHQMQRLRDATPEQVEHARLKFRSHLFFIRRLVKKLGGSETKGHSLNILTFFGKANEMKDFDVSMGSVKITRTLMLGGFMGLSFALDVAFNEFLERLPSWLADRLRKTID